MTYNVHLFDWFNRDNPQLKRDKIIKLIAENSPDVLCIQEFFHNPKKKFNTLDSIRLQNNFDYFYFDTYNENNNKKGFGMIILSRFPIVNKGKFEFEHSRGNSALYVDVLKGNDTIRIYNVHLESNRFHQEDFEVFYVSEQENLKNKNWKTVIKGLRTSAQLRAKQADEVLLHIKQCHYPVIVCGDFNDTPTSYAVNCISRHLKDAFLQKGIGIGQTYNGLAPSFRIDYIMHSDSFETTDFETHPEEYSDHHPVTATLLLKNITEPLE